MVGVTVFRGGVEVVGAVGALGVIGVIGRLENLGNLGNLGSLEIKNYSLLTTHYSLFLVRSREMWCITNLQEVYTPPKSA